MSKRAGGRKRRRWSNMRNPGNLSWKCGGCGATVREDHEKRVRYGDKCGACREATKPHGGARCPVCSGLLSNPPTRPCSAWQDHGRGT